MVQWVRGWQWSDQLVLMDSQCVVPPHWSRPSPVYKGSQQWDTGTQPKEQVERLEEAGGSREAALLQLSKLLALSIGGAAGTWR